VPDALRLKPVEISMSNQLLALMLTLAFFALLAAWVPFLDFLKRQRRERNPELDPAQAFSPEQTHESGQ
jgi:hypothetical protein